MSMQYVTPGTVGLRGFTLEARADGAPITTGIVGYALKALSGVAAGKFWNNGSWQPNEVLMSMTHYGRGHWAVLLPGRPFEPGIRYLEYAVDESNLAKPVGRFLDASLMSDIQAAIKGMDIDLLTFDQWVALGLGTLINKKVRDGANIEVYDRAGTTAKLRISHGAVAGDVTGSTVL